MKVILVEKIEDLVEEDLLEPVMVLPVRTLRRW
jgi:hypothetical protein